MTAIDKDLLYWEQRLANDRFLATRRWWWRHFLNGALKSQQERLRLQLAAEAENQVADHLRRRGYTVHATTPNCPFDLWCVSGPLAARVEVKLSYYHPHPDKPGGRFQADVRQAANIDCLVWIARNGRDWTYVIPAADLAGRRNLAIWSACPGDYRGQWNAYLEAWPLLDRVLTASRPHAWQISLPPSLVGEGSGGEVC